jgi:hypothetical protein
MKRRNVIKEGSSLRIYIVRKYISAGRAFTYYNDFKVFLKLNFYYC